MMQAFSSTPTSNRGFRLQVESAQLSDLIQITCQNGTTAAFAIVSDHGEGRLYFDAGRLVHAQCGDQSGLEALVLLLEWPGGDAVAIDAAPPERSIDMSSDALLLHAAKLIDERGRDGRRGSEPTTGVVRKVESRGVQTESVVARAQPSQASHPPPLPGSMRCRKPGAERESDVGRRPDVSWSRGASDPVFERETSRPPPLAGSMRCRKPGVERLPPSRHHPPSSRASQPGLRPAAERETLPPPRRRSAFDETAVGVVRMSLAGSFRQCTGGASQDLADRVFFAQRSLTTLGRALGLGPARALQLRGERDSLVVCTGESITGVEGRCEATAVLAKKLGVS